VAKPRVSLHWLLALSILFCSALTARAQTLSPVSVSFGNWVLENTSTPKAVTLSNTQSASVAINSISTSGDFAQTSGCPIAPKTLAAGASCKIVITFTPTALGQRAGILTISSDSESPQTALTGTGQVPVSLSPASFAFPPQGIGTASAALGLTLKNNQTVPLTISSISTSGDFSQTSTCPLSPSTLPSGTSCTISVTFTPLGLGIQTGSLTVIDDAINSPQAATFSGGGSISSLLSMSVTPANATLTVANQQQFAATGTFPGGVQANITNYVNWSSSDSSVASVSSTGLVDAIAEQTATIAASHGTTTGSGFVTVADALGTANSTAVSCPAGGLTGDCYAITISCPGVNDFTGYVKVSYPTGTPLGTVVFSSGGNGTNFYESNYTYGTTVLNGALQGGFTLAQTTWEHPFSDNYPYGWQTGPGGIRAVACRYATIAQWVYTNIHQANAAAPFCATGNSGGAEEIGQALAHYGLGSIFAMVEPTSGPPFAQQAWACDGLQPDAVNPCGISAGYGLQVAAAQQFVDPAYSSPMCSEEAATHSTTYDDIFLQDSVVAPDAALSYPNTFVNFRYGALDGSVGPNQAQTWETAITTSKASSCIPGAGHGIPDTLDGAQQIANDIVAFCKLP